MSTVSNKVRDTSTQATTTIVVDEIMVKNLNHLLTEITGKEGMVDILTGLYMDYSKLIIRNIQCQGEVEIPHDFDNQLSFLRELINVFSGKYTD